MAGKKDKKPAAKKKRSTGGRKPKKVAGKDVVKTEPFNKAVRVPINAAEAARKERMIREHLNVIADHEEAMKPHKKGVRDAKKEIDKLRKEVNDKSEEVELEVYAVKDYTHSNIQFVRADNDEVVEDRTMTAEERQRDWVAERGEGGVMGGKAGSKHRLPNPVLTPGEAAAAARKEDDASSGEEGAAAEGEDGEEDGGTDLH